MSQWQLHLEQSLYKWKIEQSASAFTQDNNQVLLTGILSILFYLHAQAILKFSQNSLK